MASRSTAAAVGFDQVVGFLESFAGLEEPRQRAQVLYPLDEVLTQKRGDKGEFLFFTSERALFGVCACLVYTAGRPPGCATT